VNKAISGLYPPGSTIKTLVTISALENDVVNPKMVQQCKGILNYTEKNFIVGRKKVMVLLI
jgi:cell division protein FtsI/penicillin-binding protein 2